MRHAARAVRSAPHPSAERLTVRLVRAVGRAAIVSPLAGTTRDVVQVTLQLGGLPVLLSDTAGLREHTDDPIELQGMQRASGEARRAHIQLWVYDASEPPVRPAQLDTDAALGLTHDAAAVGDGLGLDNGDEAAEAVRLLVLNKVDLLDPSQQSSPALSPLLTPKSQWRLSCETGVGLQAFLDALASLVVTKYGATTGGEATLITRARHREHLRLCSEALLAFEGYAELGDSAPLDLAAEEIRIAANELGRITGRIDVEELLDVIFRDFCIGK